MTDATPGQTSSLNFPLKNQQKSQIPEVTTSPSHWDSHRNLMIYVLFLFLISMYKQSTKLVQPQVVPSLVFDQRTQTTYLSRIFSKETGGGDQGATSPGNVHFTKLPPEIKSLSESGNSLATDRLQCPSLPPTKGPVKLAILGLRIPAKLPHSFLPHDPCLPSSGQLWTQPCPGSESSNPDQGRD